MKIPLTLALLCLVGCGGTPAPSPNTTGTLFSPTGSPWLRGPLETIELDVREGEFEAPRPLRIHAPKQAGTYGLVQFQHGFLSDIRAYDEILSHLASHGFVVVAPQMYPADGIPLGKPPAREEAEAARAVATWAQRNAATLVGSAADPRPHGMAGHSRGGKVTWLLSAQMETRGLVGVDPVDGKGGPLLSAQPEALPGPLSSGPPSLIVGLEKGGSCAPEGDNYQHFFEHAASPTRLLYIPGHGHGDMLDADVSTSGLCFEGPDRARVRQTTAGALSAFFRLTLLDDASMNAHLTDATLAPMETTLNAR